MTDDRRGAEACRRFQLIRREDESGVSGTGVVAYGVLFPDGRAVLRWDTKVNSTVFYESVADLEAIHGHGGKTVIHWLDPAKTTTDQGGHPTTEIMFRLVVSNAINALIDEDADTAQSLLGALNADQLQQAQDAAAGLALEVSRIRAAATRQESGA